MIDHFGLDIGSDSIKIIQLDHDRNNFKLISAGIARTPVTSLSFDQEKDIVKLAEAIKRLKVEAGVTTEKVAIAIPERSVFSQIIEVPKMSDEELSQAIPWEAENVIPSPLSEVNLDWEIVSEDEDVKDNKMKVLLVAAPSILVNKYLQVLQYCDLRPVSVEVEGLAIIRSLRPVIDQGNLILLNMGARSLDIILLRRGNIFLSRQLASSGEAITRSIANGLGLDLPTAEEYKKTYGLSPQFEGKVAAVIEPVLSAVVNEIKKAVRFYEEKDQSALKLVILTGGTSLLVGIAEYFTKHIGMEVLIADPLTLAFGNQPNLQPIKSNSPLFTVACGLAMKNV